MATWLIEHGDAIAHLLIGFGGGVFFAAWRQVSLEMKQEKILP